MLLFIMIVLISGFTYDFFQSIILQTWNNLFNWSLPIILLTIKDRQAIPVVTAPPLAQLTLLNQPLYVVEMKAELVKICI